MTTEDSTAEQADKERRAALKLIRLGAITQAEAAQLTGQSRQLVRTWVDAAGIDWKQARADALARLWARATRRRG